LKDTLTPQLADLKYNAKTLPQELAYLDKDLLKQVTGIDRDQIKKRKKKK
jgi:hypothetical protein